MSESASSFVGIDGRARVLRFDVDTARKARDGLDVLLSDIFTADLDYRIRTDVVLAVDLAFLASGEDDPVAFAKCVGVEKLLDMTDAVIGALSDFSDRLTRGGIGPRIVQGKAATFEAIMAVAEARSQALTIEQINEMTDRLTRECLERASSGATSTSSPGSSESTQDDSPTES